jgi:hypothetical protein
MAFYHRKLAYHLPSKGLLYNVTAILPLTINFPTVYRPTFEHMSESEQQYTGELERWEGLRKPSTTVRTRIADEVIKPSRPSGQWLMVDWDIAGPNHKDYMSMNIADLRDVTLRFEDELPAISDGLNEWYEAWRRKEDLGDEHFSDIE